MQSLADGLPPEFQQHVHPDWRKNEAEYWLVRDKLLEKYRREWIGFAGGKVVASGNRPVTVLHAARQAAEHPFFTCVGREKDPFRIRRTVFAYDAEYGGEPLPVIRAEFRQNSGMPGIDLEHVIAETGSDSSVLPWLDCQKLRLDPAYGLPSAMSGVAGESTTTFSFIAWVFLDNNEYQCQILVDFHNGERILGRDVLNSMDVLFRGPSREIILNP